MMDDTEDPEFDPAMLEAMGFSSFGAKPGKKRKLYSADEAFIDPRTSSTGASKAASATGAKLVVQSDAHKPRQSGGDRPPAIPNQQTFEPPASGAAPSSFASSVDGSDEESLLALRNGVQNQYGDMVYFLPDFLEDPWKRLAKS